MLCNLHQIDYARSSASASSACRPARVVYRRQARRADRRGAAPHLSRPRRCQRHDAAAAPDERRRAAAEAFIARRARREGMSHVPAMRRRQAARPARLVESWAHRWRWRRRAVVGGRRHPVSVYRASSRACPGSRLLGRMLPPNLAFMQKLVKPAIETVQIALWGTPARHRAGAAGLLLGRAQPLAVPGGVPCMRQVLNVMRGINEIILALIFVAAVGLGPFPGVLALALHGAGMLGKFFAEAIEEIDQGPIEALRATGAGPIQIIVFGVLPQVIPTWIAVVLYRFETNLRAGHRARHGRRRRHRLRAGRQHEAVRLPGHGRLRDRDPGPGAGHRPRCRPSCAP